MSESVSGIETVDVNTLIDNGFDLGGSAPTEEVVSEPVKEEEPVTDTTEEPTETKEEESVVEDKKDEEPVKPRWKSLEDAEKSFREQQSMASKKEAELRKQIEDLKAGSTQKEEPVKEVPVQQDKIAKLTDNKIQVLNLKDALIKDIKAARASGNTEAVEDLKLQLEETSVLLEACNFNIEMEKENLFKAEAAAIRRAEELSNRISSLSRNHGDAATDRAMKKIKAIETGENVEDYHPVNAIFKIAALEEEIESLKKKGGNAPSLEGPGKKKASQATGTAGELDAILGSIPQRGNRK